MSWYEKLASAAILALFRGGREIRKANQAEHAEAVERKADIDRRHVERRDLSKDKRK